MGGDVFGTSHKACPLHSILRFLDQYITQLINHNAKPSSLMKSKLWSSNDHVTKTGPSIFTFKKENSG